MQDAHKAGPLAGFRVIDLTTTMMGPWCATYLARLGADVIKVEPPTGDITRRIGRARTPGMSTTFFNLNAGKRSVVIDLKADSGPEVMLKLIDRADVFVTNIRPKALARVGVTPEVVASRSPRAVYCQLVGFGSGGPYSDHAAYDDVVQAISGLASTQGGTGDPEYVATPAADKITALNGVSAILAALLARERGASGQFVEVAMFEAMAGFILVEHQQGAVYEPSDGPVGYSRVLSPERRPYPTKDGFIGVTPYTDRHWQALFGLLGRGDLLDDPRLASIKQRTENIDLLYQILGEELSARTTSEWMELLLELEIPVAPVLSLEELFEDRHLQSVGLFEYLDHPSEGMVKQPRLPMQFAETPTSTARPVPRLGEHTIEVLHEYGFESQLIDRLIAEGSVYKTTEGEVVHG